MSQDPVRTWRSFQQIVEAAGLGRRLTYLPADATRYDFERPHDPALVALRPWLPAAFTEFVASVGYPAIDLGTSRRWAILPPPAMCQVTGAMGDPARPFAATRELRRTGSYTWPFAFFAGWDLSDINGWCFAPPASGGDPIVWVVEDSLPCKEVGTFGEWLATKCAAMTTELDSASKLAALVESLREDLEEDEELPTPTLDSF